MREIFAKRTAFILVSLSFELGRPESLCIITKPIVVQIAIAIRSKLQRNAQIARVFKYRDFTSC